MEPYYRTAEGFRVLIYKEWLYYGHNFLKSNNLNNDIPSLADQSFQPLFVLLCECVHQLMTQNPTAFDFTDDLLALLSYNNFTNKYFEFTRINHLNQLNHPQNSTPVPQKGQAALGCGELYSIFNMINFENYRNLMYIKPESDINKLRPLLYQPSDLVVWKSYFCRYQ